MISPDLVYKKSGYDESVEKVVQYIQENGTVTLAQVRDLLHTNRKSAQALMEHLDAIGVHNERWGYSTSETIIYPVDPLFVITVTH